MESGVINACVLDNGSRIFIVRFATSRCSRILALTHWLSENMSIMCSLFQALLARIYSPQHMDAGHTTWPGLFFFFFLQAIDCVRFPSGKRADE